MEIEEIPLLDWSPDELHLDPQAVARLTKIQQLPPLTAKQPFGVFILSFDGGRLPVGAVRRVVNKLVRKQRARRIAKSLWKMNDLIFFCQSNNGVGTLHVVAFRDTDNVPIMKVITWDTAATENRIELIATQNLPALCWPNDEPIDTDRWRDQWSEAFTAGYREGIRSSAALAAKMADVARVVRDEVLALYSVETKRGPLRQLFDEVKASLRADLTPASFADMYAQTMVYGLLTSRITHPEAFSADALNSVLKFENPFLDALYASFRRRGDQAFDVDDFGLHDLAEILSRVDMDQVLADFGAADRKDDPVVFFYEEFLDRYDPAQRRALGTYYTPIPIVRFMVRAVDEIIKSDFALSLGVADQTTWSEYSKTHGMKIPTGVASTDPVIRMIDPATGTGTFLLEWMRLAEANLRAAGKFSFERMRAVVGQMDAFEISLSSYAVAHLKTSLELDPAVRAHSVVGVRLTDTLAGRVLNQMALFGDDPISVEGQRAEHVKFERRHSVVIGNPPYDRVDRSSAGGWIAHPPDGGKSLFDDILDPARQNTNFAHQASLYNLFVYFWRWAMWKTFEQLSEGPGVACFITPSSWLTGPGFMGLRAIARRSSSNVYVVDLGGNNTGARPEENVFPIQTPVAIVILARKVDYKADVPAAVRYIRIAGTKEEKFAGLTSLNLKDANWMTASSGWMDSFVAGHSSAWTEHPALTDLIPWQQPGCKYGRTWPIGTTEEVLRKRWLALVATTNADARARAFVTSSSGRNIYTQVSDLPRLVDLKPSSRNRPIRRYAYRSFDRQYAIEDPRLAKTESPSLWRSLSDGQVFIITKTTHTLGGGPAAVVSTMVPDLDHFRGSYGGKDVIPLFRDADGTPNSDPALLERISELLGLPEDSYQSVTPSSLFTYCFGVLAGTDYTNRFSDELEQPGPRIPISQNRVLFDAMAAHGEELLWLQTFGERFQSTTRNDLRIDSTIYWKKEPTKPPLDSNDFSYDSTEGVLKVADGVLVGVSREVWQFEVSGLQVIKKWLGYRTVRGAGKAVSSESPLDKIRPSTWNSEWSTELREIVHVLKHTLNLLAHGTSVLQEILNSELILASDLPLPPEELRKPPSGDDMAGMFDKIN